MLNEFVSFLPLFAKIDSLLGVGKTVVAIDGGSASGKTTLAATLSKIYDCNVIHVDDFFLRPEQRTPDRLSEVGGNMDRERLLEEVLIPLSKDLPIRYRKYDCSTMTLGDDILLTKKPLTIIEGAYSMHPDLTKYYDLGVFLDISNMQQRTRIEKRNSAPMAKRFFNEWIPLENLYFEKTCIRERAELVFKCEIAFESEVATQ
ncbi:MAG: phosphoribulokinase [Clostridia bacterium]|nr:phosphoribulokinase [Clostridia bacterium]